jgi:hypothetical protein
MALRVAHPVPRSGLDWAPVAARLLALLTLPLLLLPAGADRASAASNVVLPLPKELGVFAGQTYGVDGQRVGDATFSFRRLADGHLVVEALTAIEGGARNAARAELVPVEGGLRLLRERSESHDPEGRSLGVLRVDHERGEATCTPPGTDAEPLELPLPSDERVVNVPLNLLFLPLVRGEVERIPFQLFLCRGSPRILDFEAKVSARSNGDSPRAIVEVTYAPDLGNVVSWLASSLVPTFSFWFDANAEPAYLAHRMPLYAKGPEVLVVRDGVSPTWLSALH